ncbi:MAG: HAD-IIIA family hydrolase [Planctomycetes bacterium]|nr:HAD family hydrolase [Phycisphaerae bacterium]NBB95404.1 HAD-IIIA family hydrolase [Planctomycetota bacterium]
MANETATTRRGGRQAVFIDRDDTLLDDPGYLREAADVVLLGGAARAIADLRQAGWLVVIVTNQSGIARGLLDEPRLERIHEELRRQLAENGTAVDGIYYCPYLADAPLPAYRQDSDLRKPNPGMLLEAGADLDIDLTTSWMVGDSERDVEAGRRAGCRTVRIHSPKDPATRPASRADAVAQDLAAAARIILGE